MSHRRAIGQQGAAEWTPPAGQQHVWYGDLLSGGDWADRQGAVDGTLVGGAVLSAGSGVTLDGTGYVDISGVSIGTTHTLTMWAKYIGTFNGYIIDAQTGREIIGNQLGKIEYYDGSAWNEIGTMVDGQWHHIAVSRAGTAMLIAFDGSQIISTTTNAVALGGASVRLGTRYTAQNPDHYWIGAIDGIRLFSTALTLTQINSIRTGAPESHA